MRAVAVLTAVVLLSLAAAVVAAPVPKEVKKKRPDAEVFVGSWDTVVAETNGTPSSKATWTFDERLKMTSVPLGGGGGRGSEWAIKLDPEKSPKEITIGDYLGIYEFDGDDIRIAFASGTRPADFTAKPGVYYNLLRRVKGDGK